MEHWLLMIICKTREKTRGMEGGREEKDWREGREGREGQEIMKGVETKGGK